MAARFCPSCGMIVEPAGGPKLVVLILLLFLWVVPGVVYFLLTRKKHCPRCHLSEEFLTGDPTITAEPALRGFTQAPIMPPSAECPGCGGRLRWVEDNRHWRCDAENRYY